MGSDSNFSFSNRNFDRSQILIETAVTKEDNSTERTLLVKPSTTQLSNQINSIQTKINAVFQDETTHIELHYHPEASKKESSPNHLDGKNITPVRLYNNKKPYSFLTLLRRTETKLASLKEELFQLEQQPDGDKAGQKATLISHIQATKDLLSELNKLTVLPRVIFNPVSIETVKSFFKHSVSEKKSSEQKSVDTAVRLADRAVLKITPRQSFNMPNDKTHVLEEINKLSEDAITFTFNQNEDGKSSQVQAFHHQKPISLEKVISLVNKEIDSLKTRPQLSGASQEKLNKAEMLKAALLGRHSLEDLQQSIAEGFSGTNVHMLIEKSVEGVTVYFEEGETVLNQQEVINKAKELRDKLSLKLTNMKLNEDPTTQDAASKEKAVTIEKQIATLKHIIGTIEDMTFGQTSDQKIHSLLDKVIDSFKGLFSFTEKRISFNTFSYRGFDDHSYKPAGKGGIGRAIKEFGKNVFNLSYYQRDKRDIGKLQETMAEAYGDGITIEHTGIFRKQMSVREYGKELTQAELVVRISDRIQELEASVVLKKKANVSEKEIDKENQKINKLKNVQVYLKDNTGEYVTVKFAAVLPVIAVLSAAALGVLAVAKSANEKIWSKKWNNALVPLLNAAWIDRKFDNLTGNHNVEKYTLATQLTNSIISKDSANIGFERSFKSLMNRSDMTSKDKQTMMKAIKEQGNYLLKLAIKHGNLDAAKFILQNRLFKDISGITVKGFKTFVKSGFTYTVMQQVSKASFNPREREELFTAMFDAAPDGASMTRVINFLKAEGDLALAEKLIVKNLNPVNAQLIEGSGITRETDKLYDYVIKGSNSSPNTMFDRLEQVSQSLLLAAGKTPSEKDAYLTALKDLGTRLLQETPNNDSNSSNDEVRKKIIKCLLPHVNPNSTELGSDIQTATTKINFTKQNVSYEPRTPNSRIKDRVITETDFTADDYIKHLEKLMTNKMDMTFQIDTALKRYEACIPLAAKVGTAGLLTAAFGIQGDDTVEKIAEKVKNSLFLPQVKNKTLLHFACAGEGPINFKLGVAQALRKHNNSPQATNQCNHAFAIRKNIDIVLSLKYGIAKKLSQNQTIDNLDESIKVLSPFLSQFKNSEELFASENETLEKLRDALTLYLDQRNPHLSPFHIKDINGEKPIHFLSMSSAKAMDKQEGINNCFADAVRYYQYKNQSRIGMTLATTLFFKLFSCIGVAKGLTFVNEHSFVQKNAVLIPGTCGGIGFGAWLGKTMTKPVYGLIGRHFKGYSRELTDYENKANGREVTTTQKSEKHQELQLTRLAYLNTLVYEKVENGVKIPKTTKPISEKNPTIDFENLVTFYQNNVDTTFVDKGNTINFSRNLFEVFFDGLDGTVNIMNLLNKHMEEGPEGRQIVKDFIQRKIVDYQHNPNTPFSLDQYRACLLAAVKLGDSDLKKALESLEEKKKDFVSQNGWSDPQMVEALHYAATATFAPHEAYATIAKQIIMDWSLWNEEQKANNKTGDHTRFTNPLNARVNGKRIQDILERNRAMAFDAELELDSTEKGSFGEVVNRRDWSHSFKIALEATMVVSVKVVINLAAGAVVDIVTAKATAAGLAVSNGNPLVGLLFGGTAIFLLESLVLGTGFAGGMFIGMSIQETYEALEETLLGRDSLVKVDTDRMALREYLKNGIKTCMLSSLNEFVSQEKLNPLSLEGIELTGLINKIENIFATPLNKNTMNDIAKAFTQADLSPATRDKLQQHQIAIAQNPEKLLSTFKDYMGVDLAEFDELITQEVGLTSKEEVNAMKMAAQQVLVGGGLLPPSPIDISEVPLPQGG